MLRTIPEPPGIAPAKGGATSATPSAPPETTSTRASVPTSESPPAGAPPDTTSEAPSDSQVPVPMPTQPLGQQQGSRATATLPDSLATPATAPSSAPGAAAGPGAMRIASPDSCWRVQIGARQERVLADRLADAARSQLLLQVVVEHEGSLFKVRTRDCFSAAAADDLRRRAADSGFRGAFRFLRKKH